MYLDVEGGNVGIPTYVIIIDRCCCGSCSAVGCRVLLVMAASCSELLGEFSLRGFAGVEVVVRLVVNCRWSLIIRAIFVCGEKSGGSDKFVSNPKIFFDCSEPKNNNAYLCLDKDGDASGIIPS